MRTTFQTLLSHIPVPRPRGPRPVALAVWVLLTLVAVLAFGPAAGVAAAAPLGPPHGIHGKADITVALDAAVSGTLAPGSAFTWTVTLHNQGYATGTGIMVDVPLSSDIVVDNYAAGAGLSFVDALTPTDMMIRFTNMDAGTTDTAQIWAHVASTAGATDSIAGRAMVQWDGGTGPRTNWSDNLMLTLGGSAPAPAGGTALGVSASGPVPAGTMLTFTGGAFTAQEWIGLWINLPAGTQLAADSLGQTDTALAGAVAPLDLMGWADDTGTLTYNLDTTGLPSGTYSLVAQGVDSGVQYVTSFTIQ